MTAKSFYYTMISSILLCARLTLSTSEKDSLARNVTLKPSNALKTRAIIRTYKICKPYKNICTHKKTDTKAII